MILKKEAVGNYFSTAVFITFRHWIWTLRIRIENKRIKLI